MTRVEPSSRPQQPRSYDQWMFRQSDDTEDDQVSVYYLDDQNYTCPPPYYDNPPPPDDANPASRSQTPTNLQSFTCDIILSCFAIWLCGVLLGLIAFFLAGLANAKPPYWFTVGDSIRTRFTPSDGHSVSASCKASNGDQQRARDLGSVSYQLSTFAIGVGVCVWITVLVLAFI